MTHAHGDDVSFKDVKKKSQIEDLTRDVNDIMHRKRARRILGDLRKVRVESCFPKNKDDFRLLAEVLWRMPHVVWGRWKSRDRKMVSLSLCRKTFKLKGNKKFRTRTKKS